MPHIAITECRKLDDYKKAVEQTGSPVRIVSHETSIEAALEGIDGLVLTGGDDVAPGRYGEEKHAAVVEVRPERDDFEISLVHEARRRHIPILAICRGVQVLNVACGGSLVQDIPSQKEGALEHRTKAPRQPFDIGHEIHIEKDSLLASLLSERLTDAHTCDVNSRHHQSVKTIAPGFRVVATAPDGVIEAIEDPRARFCLGVQWHPENFWRTGEFKSLFEGLVAAATPLE